MGNHVHLLVKEGQDGLSEAIKRIATSYARYFNARYDRTGYLFQSRFKSELIQNDSYLPAAVRYILNNPVVIGEAITYWTSFYDYTEGFAVKDRLTDTGFVLEMFSPEPKEAAEMLAEFVAKDSDSLPVFLDESKSKHIRDEHAIELIKNAGQVSSCSALAYLEKEDRDRVLVTLKERGLSVRQISRLTSINRSIVLQAGKPERMTKQAGNIGSLGQQQDSLFF